LKMDNNGSLNFGSHQNLGTGMCRNFGIKGAKPNTFRQKIRQQKLGKRRLS